MMIEIIKALCVFPAWLIGCAAAGVLWLCEEWAQLFYGDPSC